jgi:hypothetical protein
MQQDATLHSLFYLETALHVSGGATTQKQFPDKINCVMLHLVGYILEYCSKVCKKHSHMIILNAG